MSLFGARGWNLLGSLLFVVGAGLLVVAGWMALSGGDDGGRLQWTPNPAVAAMSIKATSIPTVAPPQAIPEPTPPPELPTPVRVVIPKIGVAAPVTVKGVDASGTMQNPDGAFDVAWYDFSGKPGSGSNVVLAGHLDYIRVGAAVFWRLKDLSEGDVVQVELEGGGEKTYVVTESGSYDASTAPVQEIVGPTPEERLTLITCNGRFNPRSGNYDERLIVKAKPA